MTPKSGRAHLAPLFRDYVSYLTADWRFLVSDCEIETMVRNAVGQNLRHTFKTAEFHSIGHLLDVCSLHRDDLESISLPRIDPADISETCEDRAKVKQALRNLRREIITVNGHVIPPAKTTGELASLLAEAINSVSSPAPASRDDDDGREGSGIIFEERDIDTSEVPKRGSKLVLGYEGGRLPIRNVDGGGNELEVADMCDLPSLHEVRSYLRLIDD